MLDAESSTLLERNKAVVRRYLEDVLGNEDAQAIDEILTEDFVGHSQGPFIWHGREGLKLYLIGRRGSRMAATLFDQNRHISPLPIITIREMVAEGDLVAVRTTREDLRMDFDPEVFNDIPAVPANTGITIVRERIPTSLWLFRLRDGKIAEEWHEATSGRIRPASPQHNLDPST